VKSCDLACGWVELEISDSRRSSGPGWLNHAAAPVGVPSNPIPPRELSMAELEEVVSRLLDDPATEPIASEIGGASGLTLLRSMKNHLGKSYSPSTAMMLSAFGNLPRNPPKDRTRL